MFQVTPDQERTMLIGDMLSDGLLIVEFPPSPPSTPASKTHPSVLMTPEIEGARNPLDTPSAAEERRKVFGRNASYGTMCAPSSQDLYLYVPCTL